MKKIKSYGFAVAVLFAAAFIFNACTSSEDTQPDFEVSDDVVAMLENANFDVSGVFATTFMGERGYVVEGDMFLSNEYILNEMGDGAKILNTEQYRTKNLVSGLPRTITVSIDPALGSLGSNALNDALSMYNSQNLLISFQRVNYGGKGKKAADIIVDEFYELESGGFITLGRAAGFPTRKGDPAKGFGINSRWFELLNPSRAEVAGTMAHEIGHCIGLRHTDYMTRESCGQNINEGSAGVGAIHIPGTPTGSDSQSLMQACGPSNSFNNNDKIALDYIY